MVREWKLQDGHQITIYERLPGIKFGNHFHKGTDPSKNPERLFVVKGKMKVILKKDEKEDEIVLSAGQEIIIYPGVIHSMETISDEPVILIEYRTNYFDPLEPDTFEV